MVWGPFPSQRGCVHTLIPIIDDPSERRYSREHTHARSWYFKKRCYARVGIGMLSFLCRGVILLLCIYGWYWLRQAERAPEAKLMSVTVGAWRAVMRPCGLNTRRAVCAFKINWASHKAAIVVNSPTAAPKFQPRRIMLQLRCLLLSLAMLAKRTYVPHDILPHPNDWWNHSVQTRETRERESGLPAPWQDVPTHVRAQNVN